MMLEAEIMPNITVSELKRTIEREFNYGANYFNGYHPRLLKKGDKVGTLLDDDNKTLIEYNIQNYSTVTFSKIKNIGGNKEVFNYFLYNLSTNINDIK